MRLQGYLALLAFLNAIAEESACRGENELNPT
jgi:hypothetical protein